jgi:RNA polymerase sigma factor (sigma-70 family)
VSTGGPPPLPPSGPADADWLEASRRVDPVAEEALFHAYFERLIRLIRRRLSRRLSRRFDPEDIVLSAWRSFFLRARAGEFTKTGPDGDLWPLLATLTLRKLSKHVRRHQSASRSIDRDFPLAASPQLIDTAAEAETAAVISDEIESLLARLDATDQEILIQTLQGADPAAIAADLDCTDRTIRRSLETIRMEAAALSNLDTPFPRGPDGGSFRWSPADSPGKRHHSSAPRWPRGIYKSLSSGRPDLRKEGRRQVPTKKRLAGAADRDGTSRGVRNALCNPPSANHQRRRMGKNPRRRDISRPGVGRRSRPFSLATRGPSTDRDD